MTENEFILYDRLEVIRTTIEKYGENTFYLSFSGGKDSTVVHRLLDMALPDNKIPRVFMNTGIEYNELVKFVKSLADHDKRIIMLKPEKPIKETLEKYGYPFKSKQYSEWYSRFQPNREKYKAIKKKIDENPELLQNYDFIHNLKGVKWFVKEYYGVRERERPVRVR